MTHGEAIWHAWLNRRSLHVLDRILRFHPRVPDEGAMLRGWHPSARWGRPYHIPVVSTGEVIRRFGREALVKLRGRAKPRLRHGRRHYWSIFDLINAGIARP